MHAHSHYEFFRSLLADRYQQNLEALLSFLCEVTRVPVLLSLLLVIFKSRGLKQREVRHARHARRNSLWNVRLALRAVLAGERPGDGGRR